ncbi:uncharacterized protein MONOS_9657 [Monocercomonoides exilis]|uniref:uncharacterized protein n=1 Tax=Monocercomonoides exilis TaxID=2049356 RepID=UPI003559B9FC|nr:hypothetical protein MONOS_9657 [Monocercomonoides exilis]|eukprot:MONOS_9657.1-p1 / transcript=MONOS_9657.1 / gene=MONOS_9657 / organism=Monocercomonoides_exilis_PA203 / gene_product=unspecified product / transcript_product=unspecified product / location=Mono_scaffold00406:37662-38235(-) / protein_length=112 / sequence_SO=supercontig / SO=protein_coding / is_pseudo=false
MPMNDPKEQHVDNEAVHCRWAVGDDAGRAEHAAHKKPGSGIVDGQRYIGRTTPKRHLALKFLEIFVLHGIRNGVNIKKAKKETCVISSARSEGADMLCERTYPVSSSEAVL